MTIAEDRTAANADMDVFEPRRPAPRPDIVDVERFHSPEIFAAEMVKLWGKVWQIGCMASEIPNPGDYYEYVVGDWSFLIVRASAGELKAYHNVCHHRGRKVKTGTGNAGSLMCIYHGWTWNLEGQITDIPERDSFCPFADDEVKLTEVSVAQFHDFVFINPDPEAAPLEDFLGGMGKIIDDYQYNRMYRWHNTTTKLRGNWKNVVDAFTENYHARTTHPESTPFVNYYDPPVRLVDDHSLNVSPFGVPDQLTWNTTPDFEEALDSMEWALQAFGEDTSMVDMLREQHLPADTDIRAVLEPVGRAGYEQMGMDVSRLSDSQIIDNWHLHVFPNALFNTYPFGYWLFRVRPSDSEYSEFDMWYFHRVPDGAELPPPVGNTYIPEFGDCGGVMNQDFSNIPHQQTGQKSPAFKGCRLSSIEARCRHMHDIIDRYMNA